MNLCPSCGNQELEEIKENVHYCNQCDATFSKESGKPKVTEHKETIIEAMSNKLKVAFEKIDHLEETLQGKSKKEGIFDHLYDED